MRLESIVARTGANRPGRQPADRSHRRICRQHLIAFRWAGHRPCPNRIHSRRRIDRSKPGAGIVPLRMGVRDQVPRLGKRARAPGSHRAHGTQHGDLSETARRAVTRGSVRLGDAGRRLDGAATRRASTKCRWGRGPGWTGRGRVFHVEDLLTAVTPDCLLLSALTRPRAQDEGSKGAPLRLFADLVERRTDVSQNAQRQL